MRDLTAYAKARTVTWLAIIIIWVTAAAITFLEDLPPVALLDGTVIGGAVLIPVIAVDAWRWLVNYRQLRHTPATEDTSLPPALDPAAAQYQTIINAQVQAYSDLQNQTRKQAKDLNDNFALWSHQMKTPLAALDLLLQVPPVNAPAARAEVRKVDRYIKMMLTYVKMNDINRDLVLEPVPLTPLVNRTVRDLADLFINKNLAVKVDKLPTIVADSQWLGFIFEQILTNAAKYTEHGGVHIYAHGDSIIIADTGIGIAASDLPRLFEPGFSGYNGRMNQKASGLGLTLSQTIAEKMGLHLSVTSQVGAGTKVSVHMAQQVCRLNEPSKKAATATAARPMRVNG